MTTCEVGNLCWWGDKAEVCPCAAVLPLVLIALGMTILVISLLLFIQWFVKLKQGGKDETNNNTNDNPFS